MGRAILAVWVLAVGTAAAAERPSFLVVITDDQRHDALGVVQRAQGKQARFPWFETPNLDRLAREGTRFKNAFVVCSLCSPSRAAMLTGRYNHENGITGNRTPLPEDAATYASLLREAGYETGYIGKWHMDGQSGQRPGFDYSASFVGQGRYMDCPVEINGERTQTTGWVDDVSTNYAIDFLKRQSDKPFLLVVGYKTPHGPRRAESAPERLAGLYADATPKPPVSADDLAPYRRDEDDARPRNRRGRPDMRAGMRVYFQLLKGVDENVGRLLETLEETGQAKNTVVVFTSDNGYFLGEHGLGDKRAAYEESIRIPLLVRLPGRTGGVTVDAM
ncbi:MAG: sulfatase-like hydrolase/transferase, partial [Planctomycetaceae bacterium]